MAKSKSKKIVQRIKPMSDEQFIREKARGLEIGKCFISTDIRTYGEGHVVVSRLHKGGKVSVGVFLLDVFCIGIKDSFYRLRIEDYELESLIQMMRNENVRECSYNEVHNWIYGGIAFAEEAGIEPDKSFNLTQYFLKEDTDDIPLIEYEFGKDGKHFLVTNSKLEASKYLPSIKKHLGDNFEVLIANEDDSEDEYWQFP